MYACFHGHSGVVKAFLNEGADADLRNMAGRTALQLAQKAGFDDAARALLEGPNIMVKPLQYLIYRCSNSFLPFIYTSIHLSHTHSEYLTLTRYLSPPIFFSRYPSPSLTPSLSLSLSLTLTLPLSLSLTY